MSQWQGKSKGSVTGYRILMFSLRVFGIRLAYFLVRFVAFYYFLFSMKSSRQVFYFYHERLGYGTLKSLYSLYLNYFTFAQSIIDKVAIKSGAYTGFKTDFEKKESLTEIVKMGKGGILLSAHVGNWEAAALFFSRFDIKVNIVMYDGEDRDIKKYLSDVSGKKRFNTIFIKDDLSHIYQINEALQSNQFVCMLADRYMPGNKTLKSDFFGKSAVFPEGPFSLVLKLKVPVAYVYAFKETKQNFRFYASEIKCFDKANGDSTQSIMDDYTDHLEKSVRKYPLQWYNYYDFWQN